MDTRYLETFKLISEGKDIPTGTLESFLFPVQKLLVGTELGNKLNKYFSDGKLNKKLIHRHPHIYNKKNNKKRTKKEVENSWEKLKLKEKGRKKVLDGVPEKNTSNDKSYDHSKES